MRGVRAGCCSTRGPSPTPRGTCSSSACSRSRRALADGAFDDGWTLHGIGTVESARSARLGGGTALELLPRAAQADYGALLRDHDAGLALMYTPHPSLVPLEMASAGLLTVTNTFENKTAGALQAISPNLIRRPRPWPGVAAALADGGRGRGGRRRARTGSAVRWSRDWDASFDRELLERVAGLLRR